MTYLRFKVRKKSAVGLGIEPKPLLISTLFLQIENLNFSATVLVDGLGLSPPASRSVFSLLPCSSCGSRSRTPCLFCWGGHIFGYFWFGKLL
jgi:hypothetical protein